MGMSVNYTVDQSNIKKNCEKISEDIDYNIEVDINFSHFPEILRIQCDAFQIPAKKQSSLTKYLVPII